MQQMPTHAHWSYKTQLVSVDAVFCSILSTSCSFLFSLTISKLLIYWPFISSIKHIGLLMPYSALLYFKSLNPKPYLNLTTLLTINKQQITSLLILNMFQILKCYQKIKHKKPWPSNRNTLYLYLFYSVLVFVLFIKKQQHKKLPFNTSLFYMYYSTEVHFLFSIKSIIIIITCYVYCIRLSCHSAYILLLFWEIKEVSDIALIHSNRLH